MTSATHLEPRTYFRTLDGALADFGLALGAVEKVRETVRHLHAEHVYIPQSRQFIVLEADDGGDPIAYITPAYVALHPRDGQRSWVELPARADAPAPSSASGTSRAVSARVVAPKVTAPEPVVCEGCFTHLPATGVCDFCG